MEFIDLSRHLAVDNPTVRPISELRMMKPLLVDQNLDLLDTPENLQRARELAKDGWQVVRIEKRSPKSAFADRTEFPRRVILELTSKCNFLCRMCPQNGLLRPRMHMDKEIGFKVLDELDRQGIDGLWLYHLGESILHPDFREIMDYLSAKENLGTVWLSTNGQAFTDERIRTVLESKIDFLNYLSPRPDRGGLQDRGPARRFRQSQGQPGKVLGAEGPAQGQPRPPGSPTSISR